MVGHHGKTAIVEALLSPNSPITLDRVCRGTLDAMWMRVCESE